MKEIKKKKPKWKASYVRELGNIVNMTIPLVDLQIQCSPHQNTAGFFVETDSRS